MRSDDVKRIDIKEFREFGYLQELNRQFLHPLGLALEVISEEDGSEHLGGVWDYRDDSEGIYFGDGAMTREKYENVQREWCQRQRMRKDLLGFVEQDPPPGFAKAQPDSKATPGEH